jgi:hypothetical protein
MEVDMKKVRSALWRVVGAVAALPGLLVLAVTGGAKAQAGETPKDASVRDRVEKIRMLSKRGSAWVSSTSAAKDAAGWNSGPADVKSWNSGPTELKSWNSGPTELKSWNSGPTELKDWNSGPM